MVAAPLFWLFWLVPVTLGLALELPVRVAPAEPLEPPEAAFVGEPEPEVLDDVGAVDTPVGVGSCANRSLDWKVTQFDEEGILGV